jgi:superfamily II DNA helicase RecQ
MELGVKLATLSPASREPFTVRSYTEAKGAAIAAADSKLQSQKAAKSTGSSSAAKTEAEGDILHPELFELLREWRYKLATEQSVPAYVIATQKALTGISNTLPTTPAQLLAIKGIGKAFLEKYGTEVLSIIEEYKVAISGTE